MSQPIPIKVTCQDGVELAALLIEPTQAPRAAVMMSGGTGFKKEFYLPFANFLAAHGFAVITYDYRGTCGSAPADLSTCRYNYWEYGTQDMPAVLETLETRYPTLPKLIFGHSVGGQKVGLMPNFRKVKGLVTFATGAGYLAAMRMPYRLKAWYFFKIFTPLSILFTGYVKAKSFNIMENLPATVVRHWAAWCDVPDYFFNKKYYGTQIPKGHFHELSYPIHIFWATDDPLATWQNVSTFWSYAKSEKGIDFQALDPKDYGNQTIDHFGFFRKNFRDSLWQLGLNKLEEMLKA
jgi:predicted alpha/beta hydrolase